MAHIDNEVFVKVCRMDLALNGFCFTGIYPLNRNVLNDFNFLPLQVTETTNHAGVDIARSEGSSHFHFTPPTSSAAKVRKEISSLSDCSQHKQQQQQQQKKEAILQVTFLPQVHSRISRRQNEAGKPGNRKTVKQSVNQ
jgi:hypothetical protein